MSEIAQNAFAALGSDFDESGFGADLFAHEVEAALDDEFTEERRRGRGRFVRVVRVLAHATCGVEVGAGAATDAVSVGVCIVAYDFVVEGEPHEVVEPEFVWGSAIFAFCLGCYGSKSL